jgi:hypothetical protein
MACGRNREWGLRADMSPESRRGAGLRALEIRGADSSPKLTDLLRMVFGDGYERMT